MKKEIKNIINEIDEIILLEYDFFHALNLFFKIYTRFVNFTIMFFCNFQTITIKKLKLKRKNSNN